MAIVRDATGSVGDTTTSPITWNQIIATSQELLIIGIEQIASTQPTTTAVTFNGVSMIKIKSVQQAMGSMLTEISFWAMWDPPAGTYQISATATIGTSGHFRGQSVSYSGAQQSIYPDNITTTAGTTNTTGDKTLVHNTFLNNCWVLAIGVAVASTAPTWVVDQTELGTGGALASTQPGSGRMEDTNAAVTPAGSQTMGFTLSGGTAIQGWSIMSISIAPITSIHPVNTSLRPRPFSPGLAR